MLRNCTTILDKKRLVLGESHPETLKTMSNLVCNLGAQGKYIEAHALCKECLDLRRIELGDSHPDTVGSLYNLGLLTSKIQSQN
jgi:hypothetical protein